MVLFNVIPNPAKTETWLSYEDVDQNRIEQNKTSQKCLMNMLIQQNKNKQ